MTEKFIQFAEDTVAIETAPDLIAQSRAQLFIRFVDFWLVLCTLGWTFVMIFLTESRITASLILASALFIKIALRLGRVELAKYMLVGAWTVFLLVAPASGNGVTTPLLAFITPYLLLTFWLFGRRVGAGMALLLVLSVILYWLAPVQGWIVLPGILQAPGAWLISWIASLAFTGLIVWFLFRHYESLLQLQGELQQQAQVALQHTSQANLELESLSAFNQAILHQSPLPMAVFETGGACIQVNDVYAHLVGVDRDCLQNFHNFTFWKNSKLGDACHTALATGLPQVCTLHEPALFGRDLWLDCQVLPIRINNQKHILLQLVDLTERIKAEIALRTSEKAIRTLVDSVSSVIVMKDAAGRYLLINAAYQKILGIPESQILGKTAADFQSPDVAKTIVEKEKIVMTSAKSEIYEETLHSVDGNYSRHFTTTQSPLIGDDGEVYGICGVSTDITDRKLLEEELKQLAFQDALTRLPNRRLLLDRLAQAIKHSKRSNNLIAVLFIDLNKFKQLNDMHGHQVGDLLLIEVAERLKSVIRKADTVARLGGDEFVVLLEGLCNEPGKAANHAEQLAEEINRLLAEKYVLGNIHHVGSASVGVKVVTELNPDPDQILKDADAAMYQIKKKLPPSSI